MLELRHITRSFDDLPAVDDISLEVGRGELVCLLGPSGCGKTTLLHIIAGLDDRFKGQVLFEGENIKDVAIHHRDFGLMFQDFALFPHMTVAENILFGLKMGKMDLSKREERLGDVLRLVGLLGYEARDVTQLSGGEKQRVALARSLAPRPRLLMLDEPLGSLDAVLRKRLVIELREIIKRVGLTSIYVTHDQEEAFAIADRVVIMNTGRIEQIGSPETVYWHPRSAFVAQFLGLENIVPVQERTSSHVITPVGEFLCEYDVDHVLIHPAGLHVSECEENGTIQAIVKERIFNGESYILRVHTEYDVNLRLRVSSFQDTPPNIDDHVQLVILPSAVIPLL